MSGAIRKYDLERVVEMSNLIIIAEKEFPFETTEMVSILPEGSNYEGKNDPPYFYPPHNDKDLEIERLNRNYAPYTCRLLNVKVKEVLLDRERSVKTGEVISIKEGQSSMRLSLHKMYNLEGKRKIPIFYFYDSPLSYETRLNYNPLIIFIRASQNGFELTAAESFDSLNLLEQVKGLLL